MPITLKRKLDDLWITESELISILGRPKIYKADRQAFVAANYVWTVPNGMTWNLYGLTATNQDREHYSYANIKLGGTQHFTTPPGLDGGEAMAANIFSDALKGMPLPLSVPSNSTIEIISQGFQAGDDIIATVLYEEVIQ